MSKEINKVEDKETTSVVQEEETRTTTCDKCLKVIYKHEYHLCQRPEKKFYEK